MQVTRLLKGETGKTMLAIGDGANDVSMLQEADIGVGIRNIAFSSICFAFADN